MLFRSDGYNTSDVYMSMVKKGKFAKAKNVSMINTESDEEVAGISPDGSTLLVFVDDLYTYGNIYLSSKKGKAFQKLTSVGENINLGSSMETAASLSPDGDLLYFASDRKGGFGGTDLYISKILPDGDWGIPVNLGASVNTKYNEDFPNISADGKTLYFSSEGHTGIGGFDVFISDWNTDSNAWQSPVNIGYPVNTTEDNMNISLSATWDPETESMRNRYAYISAYRKEGFGDLDIYRVTFNKVEPRLTAIRGSVLAKILVDNAEYKTFYYYEKDNPDKPGEKITKEFPEECHPWYDKSWKFKESKKVKVKPGFEYKTKLYFEKNGEPKTFSSHKYPANNPDYTFKNIRNSLVKKKDYKPPEVTYITKTLPDALITVTDDIKGEEFTYIPSKSGKYVIILPPGHYSILVDVPGYDPISEKIRTLDKSSFKQEIVKEIGRAHV